MPYIFPLPFQSQITTSKKNMLMYMSVRFCYTWNNNLVKFQVELVNQLVILRVGQTCLQLGVVQAVALPSSLSSTRHRRRHQHYHFLLLLRHHHHNRYRQRYFVTVIVIGLIIIVFVMFVVDQAVGSSSSKRATWYS